MITKKDVETVEAIKKYLDQQAIKGNEMDWDVVHRIEVLDRLVSNLRIASVSYRVASSEDIEENFFTSECNKCDWWGSSKLLGGGGQIADTGDHADISCPVCGSYEIYDKTL